VSEIDVLEILRMAVWAGVIVSAPILVTTLVVGFVIGLLQALTSIQEMTLTFIPKLLSVVVVFFATLSFMANTMLDLFNSYILPMVMMAGGA
jgi:flagellar biosynthesis protein FliQ